MGLIKEPKNIDLTIQSKLKSFVIPQNSIKLNIEVCETGQVIINRNP